MTQQSVAASAGVGSRWWRDAVIYQIYLRSFADGDGDGVGDLLGVRSRLRYLSWLGVDALWLTPFCPSPVADGGHDVGGHRAVDPAFGTLGDTESLIIDAHRNGLKVLLDIVPNDTSTAHPALARRHPGVHAEFEDLMRFWLDRGVDGFRIGVAKAWTPDAERFSHHSRPGQLHQAFNLPYLRAGWSAAGLRKVIDDSLASTGPAGAPATWVLSNHDVQRHVTRYGDGWMGARRARAAALLTLALPGSTYLYQGEELGLPEVTDLPERYHSDPRWGSGREGCRVPIPWAYTEPPFGFSPPMVGESWLPVPAEWRNLTVEAQLGDARSMLRLYHDALRLRKELPALGDGGLRWLNGPDDVLVFERDPGFVCAVNLSARPALPDVRGALLLSSGRVSDGVLGPDSAAWWARA